MSTAAGWTLRGRDGIVVRPWRVEDAEALALAVSESIEHLRPWMAWIAQEPLPIERRRTMIRDWERERLAGGEVVLGVFLDGEVAGGTGVHRRIGPEGLEIGYWTHVRFLRRGVASEAARLVTDAAFDQPGITHVEIHHDRANVASGAVPRKLGYRLVAEQPDAPEAPAESGIECRWRITREEWTRSGSQAGR